jgi:hypothetical protein
VLLTCMMKSVPSLCLTSKFRRRNGDMPNLCMCVCVCVCVCMRAYDEECAVFVFDIYFEAYE